MKLYECRTINQYGGVDFYIGRYNSLACAKIGFETDLNGFVIVEVWEV